MIILVALPIEAKAIIAKYKLVKVDYNFYQNDTLKLFITSCHKTIDLSMYPNEAIVNIGVCGGCKDDIGKCFSISKISYDKDYYPFIYKDNPFERKALLTVKEFDSNPHMLVDLEAGVHFANLINYTNLANLFFFKIVSDCGIMPTKNTIYALMAKYTPIIVDYVASKLNHKESIIAKIANIANESLIKLKFTKAMQVAFINHLFYLYGSDYLAITNYLKQLDYTPKEKAATQKYFKELISYDNIR